MKLFERKSRKGEGEKGRNKEKETAREDARPTLRPVREEPQGDPVKIRVQPLRQPTRRIGGAWMVLVSAMCGVPGVMFAQPAVPVPATTVYTRSLLRSTNAGLARTNLGILSTNGVVTGLMPDNTTAINNGDGSFSVVFPSQTNGFGTIVYSNATAFSTRLQSTNDAAYQASLATNGAIRGVAAGSNITLTTNGALVTIAGEAAGGSANTNNLVWTNNAAAVTLNGSFVGSFTGNLAGGTNYIATIYVATNGNNATAQRGYASLPFRDIYTASTNARRGDTISVGPGVHHVTNNVNIPDDGYLIASEGPNSTFVTNWNWRVSNINGATFHPGTNSVTRGFTFVDVMRGNSSNVNYSAIWGTYANIGQPAFQNARMIDCVILGSSDGVYVQHSNICSMTLENVSINSDWDCVMVKGEPDSTVFVPHQVILRDCKITGTHGGGWTNRATYGVAIHSTGAKFHMSGGYVRMTNTTSSGTASAVSVGTGIGASDVRATINSTDLYATTAARLILCQTLDGNSAELVGVDVTDALVAVEDGITRSRHQTLSAGTLSGLPLPAVVTNWGGMPYLKWTVGSSNVWSLTRTNAGAGGILHRPAAVSSDANGNPTASAGEPYWGKVQLGAAAEVQGALPTTSVSWVDLFATGAILAVNATDTDVEASPFTVVGGVVTGSGEGLTSLNASSIASGSMPTKFLASGTTSLGSNIWFQSIVITNQGGGGATVRLTNGTVTASGTVQATNGFASFSTQATAAIAATGWTNTWVHNATVYVTATAVAFTIKDRSQATLYTSPTLTATVPVSLQPGWAVTAASGLAGTAVPF